MSKMRYYAFYGSLRKGMENHSMYAAQLRYIDTIKLRGFTIHSLKDYPYALRSLDGTPAITADLFEITDAKTEEMIYNMEIDAGYILSTVVIDKTIFGIFLFENAVADEGIVPHGDWCQFCREAAF